MNVLRLVLGDQLSHQIASLRDINIDTDIVLMAEVAAEVTYVKHHKRKIANSDGTAQSPYTAPPALRALR